MLANFFSSIASASTSTITGSPAVPSNVNSDATLAELNEYLDILCELFPEADVEDVRGRLLKSSRESRLYLVSESLLKIPSRGARRNAQQRVDAAEKFRSRHYQMAARNLLNLEFKGLSKSTIPAVMAENNHDYRKSRATLAEIASKSWRFSVSSFFRRKKSDTTTFSPELRVTGCEELDAELRELGKDRIEAQITEDRKISALLDEAEHAAASDLVGCETCYGDYSWNEIAACSVGHFICYGCLRRSVQESLYGQGQSIVGEKSSMRCLSAAASPLCEACIPPEILAKVVPEELLRAIEEKTATENLERSGLGLVRCPFCSYAEVDELQPYRIKQSAKISGLLALMLVCVFIPAIQVLGVAFIFSFTYLLKPFLPREASRIVLDTVDALSLHTFWTNTVRRIQLKRRGTLFRCQNDRCKRESCIACCKEWAPFHKCFEKEEDNVRIHIEKAMANAVKRTCPVCRISFVKADGCNKLTCVCGYIMCYICRADIRKEGYKHFCQHFRQVPGTSCADCDKCDLYVQEDEESAILEAAKKAETEYFKNHEVPVTWKYLGNKVGPVKQRARDLNFWLDTHQLQWYFDRVIEEVVTEI